MNKALFFDKDGTLVDNSMYPLVPTDDILPEVISGLQRISKNTNYLLFIISNQSFIEKGKITLQETEGVFQTLLFKLKQNEIFIKEYVYCPHKKDQKCLCRKPNTLLVENLCKKYNIDIQKSFIIGDSISDLQLAGNVHCPFIGVKNSFTKDSPNWTEEGIFHIIQDMSELKEILKIYE